MQLVYSTAPANGAMIRKDCNDFVHNVPLEVEMILYSYCITLLKRLKVMGICDISSSEHCIERKLALLHCSLFTQYFGSVFVRYTLTFQVSQYPRFMTSWFGLAQLFQMLPCDATLANILAIGWTLNKLILDVYTG